MSAIRGRVRRRGQSRGDDRVHSRTSAACATTVRNYDALLATRILPYFGGDAAPSRDPVGDQGMATLSRSDDGVLECCGVPAAAVDPPSGSGRGDGRQGPPKIRGASTAPVKQVVIPA